MKKKGIKHYLTIIALCCSICYLLLRIFGIIDKFGHIQHNVIRAEAAEPIDYQLTLQQTLALYGTNPEVIYYNKDNDLTTSAHASFIGTTLDDTYNDGSILCTGVPLYDGGTFTNDQRAYVRGLAPGLMYKVTFQFNSFVSSGSASTANISLDFSVSFDNIARFRQNILYFLGSKSNQSMRHINSVYSTSLGPQIFYAYGNGVVTTSPVNAIARYGLFPWPEYTNPVDESKQMRVACIAADIQSDELFSISNTHVTCNYCGTYDSVLPIASEEWIFIITCPVIRGLPEVTTTQPAHTTRPPYTGNYQVTTAQYTYDLSPLETNQINQINIANENLNYVAGIFDGINIIIQQLDDIYNRMVANGEIAVDLLPGDPVKWYETDVKQQIDYIIEGHTTATLPDISNQMSFIGSAYNFLMSEPWIAMLGGLSLAVSVACWVLFEGRK